MLRSDFLRALAALPFVGPLLEASPIEASPPAEGAGEAPPPRGPLQTALDRHIEAYEMAYGHRPEAFWCSRETMGALWEGELGFRLKGATAPAYPEPVTVFEYDGVRWFARAAPFGDFLCGPAGFARDFEWQEDAPRLLVHRPDPWPSTPRG